MNVLSLFDGISCLQLALERAGIQVDNYYASEINKDAIKVTQYNYPNTIQLGNVNDIDFSKLPHIDLLAAGSPCQDISNLNKNATGLKGAKSSLFYKFLEAKEILNPDNWLLENVRGKAADEIGFILKTRPIRFNSSLFTPQSRPRLYWTNICVNTMPPYKKFNVTDLLQSKVDEKYYQNENWLRWWGNNKEYQLQKSFSSLNPTIATCLTARMYKSWNGNFIQDDIGIRRLTTIECERLQTIPDGYTSTISDSKAYEAIGNGWTVDVISHILKHIK